ncbi:MULTISPECIES: hypothetical protein [unclassified Myroides]|uniref:hypothetical protein n=1 Tax=unclassified Myroides TaxID=2642485 RepID=UPI003D2F94A1
MEKIDYGTGSTPFTGFWIGKKNPITSNTIDISYENEKIAVLEYSKQKVQTECNGNLYLLHRRSIRSVSKKYVVANHREEAIADPIRIRVLP